MLPWPVPTRVTSLIVNAMAHDSQIEKATRAKPGQESAGFGCELEVGDPARCQQQQLLADVQNPGDQPSHFQRVVTGAGFAQCERPVVQGTGLHGKERKGFVKRADLLNRPLRTRTVGGVGGDG